MLSSISPCASTSTAISWNICDNSAMFCSRRRMSWCLSRMRSTSSTTLAWAPAMRRMTSCEEVWPHSIICHTSSSEASGQIRRISRSWRCSRIDLWSICNFWKSRSSCCCLRARACCMFARILCSAALGLLLSSAADFSARASKACLEVAILMLASITSSWMLSDAALWRSWVVACRISVSTESIFLTHSLPILMELCTWATSSKNSRMKLAGFLAAVAESPVDACSSRALPLLSEAGCKLVEATPSCVTVPLLRASRWNSAHRSLRRCSAATPIAV
mmetsp:Transcript_41063/g.106189  ORF Transcript_41063/g.106189 Transcript_41063/m.106189 type:complete len:277 (+) Transcript_41063:346-1176(+)